MRTCYTDVESYAGWLVGGVAGSSIHVIASAYFWLSQTSSKTGTGGLHSG
jgi:hypothetical protein